MFNLVFFRNKRRFDKWVKLNGIRIENVIDVKKIVDEYNTSGGKYAKVVLKNTIYDAITQGGDIWYYPVLRNIPEYDDIEKLLKKFNPENNLIIFSKDFDKFDMDCIEEFYPLFKTVKKIDS